MIARELASAHDDMLLLVGVTPEVATMAVAAAQGGTHSRALLDLVAHVTEMLGTSHDVRTWMRAKARVRVLLEEVLVDAAWERGLVRALIEAGIDPGERVLPIKGGALVGSVRVIVKGP